MRQPRALGTSSVASYATITLALCLALFLDIQAHAGLVFVREPVPYDFPSAPAEARSCDESVRRGRLLALLVGVSEYDRLPYALGGPSNDVRLMRSVLEASAEPEASIRTLLDAAATRESVLQALDDLIARAGCGDIAFFYFSGHGIRASWSGATPAPDSGEVVPVKVTATEQTWLLTSEARLNEVQHAAGIPGPDLAAAVVALRRKGAIAVVAVDAGYSAGLGIGNGQPDAGVEGSFQEEMTGGIWRWSPGRLLPRRQSMPSAEPMEAFAALYAASDNLAFELPIESGDEEVVHGLFTFALASALQSAASSTLRSLAGLMVHEMRALSTDASPDWGQAPAFEASDPTLRLFPGRDVQRDRGSIELEEARRGPIVVDSPEWTFEGRVPDRSDLLFLLVDHRQVQADDEGRFRTEVELVTGENEVSAVAIYRDGRMVRGDWTVRREPKGAPEPVGRRFALLIGIDDYRSDHLEDLTTAVGDAEALSETLRQRFGFLVELPPRAGSSEEPIPLVLKNPTYREITHRLTALRSTLTREDALLIFFAGHGTYVEKLDLAYWLPADADAENRGSYLSAQFLTGEVATMEARNVLVIADSCYAGAMTREAGGLGKPDESRERYIQQMQLRPSRLVMTSGATEPVWDGGGDGHSVFARALLKGLRQMEGPAFTAEELFADFVKEPVVGHSRQSPQYSVIRNSGHDGGDFVFWVRPDETAWAGRAEEPGSPGPLRAPSD